MAASAVDALQPRIAAGRGRHFGRLARRDTGDGVAALIHIDDLADQTFSGRHVHALQIGRAADQLAGLPPELFEKNGEPAPDARRVEMHLLRRE